MAVRSFQARLLYLLIAVLVLLEAGTLIAVHEASKATLGRSVGNELRVGASVMRRILDTRAGQLMARLRVVAFDYAFRDVVATADEPTISSALLNQAKRIEADDVILLDLDGTVTAEWPTSRRVGKPFPVAQLLELARRQPDNGASAIALLSDRPYQLVIVPVKAPLPIAWICAGFEIDRSVLLDLQDLTRLDVGLWSVTPGGAPRLLSTLGTEERGDLASALADRSGRLPSPLPLGNGSYATIVAPLPTGDGSRVSVLLQQDMAVARKPFAALELEIFALSLLLLVSAVVAAVIFARSVSRPLQILAEGAGRVERGDYVSPIVVEQEDEIGQLATAFNQMQSAIASREEKIIHQSRHDALTGLPNRTLFRERLAEAIVHSQRSGQAVGMIMMDVDRFQEINDTLGHNFGDQLLIDIGRRLEQTLPRNDLVARLGGDEFAVMFTAPSGENVTRATARVNSAFDAPFVLGEVSIDVAASLGIALYPEHAEDCDALMKRADVAMYDAKRNQSRFAMYEPGRDEHSLRRLSLMMELRQAVARDELELHFQPKIDVRTERVVHVEALVRWKHPRHGVMRPDEFIILAEQTGNIGIITKWVLRKAIAQCAAWSRAGLDLTVAVNLSALDLLDSDLPTFISGLVSEAGLSPTRLVLEITESAVMRDTMHGLKVLRDLKSRGVGLAIDDFGTGYSSLGHLKRMPVDELKIDKSFVQNLSETATDDLVIVRSTIELGHNMGLIVIAEGVETQESWAILKRLGCDMAQGYYMSPPLPAAKLEEWLATTEWAVR